MNDDNYISPEAIREFVRIENNPLPRPTFMKKVVDWFLK